MPVKSMSWVEGQAIPESLLDTGDDCRTTHWSKAVSHLTYVDNNKITVLKEAWAYAERSRGQNSGGSFGNRATGRNGTLLIRRWVSCHALSPRRCLATLRGSSTAERSKSLECVGRFDYRGSARPKMATAQFRSGPHQL